MTERAEGTARSFAADPSLPTVPLRPDGRVDSAAWATACGIRREQFIDLGPVPNTLMPRLCREMDAALFPNRAEGGTNLVAMECMACGLPVILSANTGHLDLIAAERCFPLTRQAPIGGDDHLGWGESDVEEAVEALETVWRNRDAALARGAEAARFMRGLGWAETAAQLAAIIAAAS